MILCKFYAKPSTTVIKCSRLVVLSFSYPGETGNAVAQLREIADRTAVMSVGLLPLIILTAGRQTLGTSSGIDFGNMMLYHRWLARFCWTHVNIHSFAWTHAVAKDNILGEQFKDPYWNWGVAATALFWGLVLLSMRQLRRKYYEVSTITLCIMASSAESAKRIRYAAIIQAFVIGHIVMAVVGLIATYYHIYLLGSPKSVSIATGVNRLLMIQLTVRQIISHHSTVYTASSPTFRQSCGHSIALCVGSTECTCPWARPARTLFSRLLRPTMEVSFAVCASI